jgi:hypothetical protein
MTGMTIEPTTCGPASPAVRRLVRLLGAIALVSAACSGQTATTPPTPPQATPAAATATPAPSPTATIPGADAAGIVWLCLPGKADNPCESTLTTTVMDASGKRTEQSMTPAADPPIDCFYVYPTISQQETTNADLSIDKEEVTIATWQAAPFSQVCKVYAPIYPQVTIAGISGGRVGDAAMVAYAGLFAAFDDYMANYNHGRGIVFIGHSQGAMLLISLLIDKFDTDPDARKLLVSALLLGGSATVAPGKTTGGDFAEIPTCSSAGQTGCVVGYSSFWETPPADAMFGRAATAVGLLRGPQPGEQLMCVNPTALAGGQGVLQPMIAAADLPRVVADPPSPLPTTTFVTYPSAYTAECKTDGADAWLQITRTVPAKAAPTLTGTEGPSWGLHDFDVAAPLGNLIELVRAQSAAFKP